jgi:hypothetical protein
MTKYHLSKYDIDSFYTIGEDEKKYIWIPDMDNVYTLEFDKMSQVIIDAPGNEYKCGTLMVRFYDTVIEFCSFPNSTNFGITRNDRNVFDTFIVSDNVRFVEYSRPVYFPEC